MASTSTTTKKTPKGKKEIDMPISKEDAKVLKKGREEREYQKRILDANKARFAAAASAITTSGTKTRSAVTTGRDIKPNIELVHTCEAGKLMLRQGDFVEVTSDTSPGRNRPAGQGFITSVEKDSTTNFPIASVRVDGYVHHDVPLKDITVVDLNCIFGNTRIKRKVGTEQPHQAAEVISRSAKKHKSNNHALDEVEIDDMYEEYRSMKDWERLTTILVDGWATKRDSGWLREEMKLHDVFVEDTEVYFQRLQNMERKQADPLFKLPTYQFTNNEKAACLKDHAVLQTYLDASSKNRYISRLNSIKNHERPGSLVYPHIPPNPYTLKYLLYAWGTTKVSISRYKKEAFAFGISRGMSPMAAAGNICFGIDKFENDQKSEEFTSIIDSKDKCEKLFTAKYLYARAMVRELVKSNADEGVNSLSRTDFHQKSKEIRERYDNETVIVKEQWEAQRRHMVARQQHIKTQLLDQMKKDNSLSYEGLANGIERWCSPGAIRRWVMSREGYAMYSERVIPLLSKEQRQKHYIFSKRFLNNWGYGAGKFLLIHYDEKWFWGMLLCKTAKKFKGLDPETIKAYHKCHISKTMGIAVVGCAFDNTLENGAVGVKIVFQRAQSAKVAKRQVSKNGIVIRKKGDIFYVDCNVTGTSHGTSADPKFALRDFFETTVFPSIQELVKEGGPFEGYRPVFQGDNAGPHQDKEYSNFVVNHCKEKGWAWEPQGPQMPHINVLDLSVFPAMSRRHSHMVRSLHGTRVVSENEIWASAVRVWDAFPSAKIANAFVQAKRIADKIVASKGGNDFLSGAKGGISANVRKDFDETNEGNRRKDGRIIKFEGTNNNPPVDLKFVQNADGSVEM